MPSYKLFSKTTNPLETLRVVFFANNVTVPAVYCKDYYAKEIEAEQNGQSDWTFNYTKAYAKEGVLGYSKWICPNLKETTLTDARRLSFLVQVLPCSLAKERFDPNFEPDVTCIAEAKIYAKMT